MVKGVFSFGIDGNGKFIYSSATGRHETEVEPTDMEAEALAYIIYEVGEVKLYQRSDAYLTICNEGGNDFCRLKVTDRTKWISIDVPQEFYDDPRLENVPNKNQRHWKIKLNRIDDIALYSDIIKAASEIVY